MKRPRWRSPIRLTRIRCPSTSVGTIEGDGMRYGLTRKAWMPSARPNATATMSTSSSRELDAEDFFFTLLADVGGRLGLGKGLRVDGLARHLGARRRRGLGGRGVLFDLGDVGRRLGLGLLVTRLARRLGIRRRRRLGGGIVQQPRLDGLLRARVAALAHPGALADAAAQVVE